jgi:hypothetical protein
MYIYIHIVLHLYVCTLLGEEHVTPYKLCIYKYRLSHMLTQFAEAKEALSTYMKKTILNDLECNRVDFTSESHHRKLLQYIYEYEVRFLRTKTHIPVHKGALLLGMVWIPCI